MDDPRITDAIRDVRERNRVATASKACRMLSTSGILGYGFPESSLESGMRRGVHMLGVDGGSTDPGPHYLGSGKTLNSARAMRRDLQLMLLAARRHHVPLVIGTCGGAGGTPHLEAVAGIVRGLARDFGLRFRLATIEAEQDKVALVRAHGDGRMARLTGGPAPDPAAIGRSERVVAMMGAEPFAAALDGGAEVVLAGRSSDPAPWAAMAMRAGLPAAPAWYAGKMLECGATPAVPKGHDCLLVDVDRDGVVLEPAAVERRCTPSSVANHSLHENPSPCIHVEPGGILDTTDCRFEAVSDRAVRVSGMTWDPQPYTVKLEGAELAGYRAITVCGTRDPLLIATIDDFLPRVHDLVATKAAALGIESDGYRLIIRRYGLDGVMGPAEPVRDARPHEIGFVIEVVAPDQDTADAVLALARVTMLHTDFPGRLCREGNMAFPYSPSDIAAGPVYRFSVFQTMTVDDPLAPFPIHYEDL
ncbi:acyclic terpene utilization AtuA family protein [Thalassobaculum sp.]|uniref:acyclic terpene utilization AtuA family protein n=1 Tax=Thalassobaculum sp. TaxID=2022740 RepID=UPI0032EACF43